MLDRPGLTPDRLYWLSKRAGSDLWQRTWFDHASRQTRRASLCSADFQRAHETLVIWWTENRRLIDERPETVTVAEILLRYYNDHASKLASATQARIACGKLSAACGSLALSEFTPQVQRAFCDDMRASGASDGYVRRTLSVAKAALAWAWEGGLVRIVPNVKLPADGQPRERVLSLGEMRAIVDAATEDHVYRFVVLACATWSRPDALLDLDRERCDTDRHLIQLNPDGRPQTKKFRPTVPLVESARHVIEDIPAGRIVTWKGRPIADIKTGWRRLRKRAGLDDGVIPYLLRHTMATEARSAGAPPWEIEGWLGHKRPTSSERYAKFAPDYLGTTATFVEAYLRKLPLRA
jgi:site-specific recombinase XerD